MKFIYSISAMCKKNIGYDCVNGGGSGTAIENFLDRFIENLKC